ncbi:MAG: hypothetical protein ACYCVB_15295 [Bacilli bacterium]
MSEFRKVGRNKVIRKLIVPAIAAAAIAVGGGAYAAAATAQSPVLLSGPLSGNIANVTVRGVAAGKAPWIVQGRVKLTRTNLSAQGKWFIIPKSGYMYNGQPVPKALAGTTAGVKTVVADITFGNSKSVITAPVKLSPQGDFSINAKVNIPANAGQPVVLIGPGVQGKIIAWFASSNFLTDYGMVHGSPGAAGSAYAAGGAGGSKGGKGSTGSGAGSTGGGW